jgi:hypothetical protein
VQLADDAAQVGQNVNQSVTVVELPTDFDVPGASRSHVVRNATVLGTERARIDQLLLVGL